MITVIDTIYSCKKKAWKKFRLVQDSVIPVQCSTNWANKPTGSRSFNWFIINPWKDDEEAMNIRKSYSELRSEENQQTKKQTRSLPKILF